MDIIKNLPISTYWKNDSYNSMFIINNYLIKMIYYKPIKVIINISGLAKVITNIVVQYYGFYDSIIND